MTDVPIPADPSKKPDVVGGVRGTRKPTGLPSWPVLLLAGREKTGKSYQAAAASASELVGRTFWVGFGEKDPDEYGAIPGARFEIVDHNGTLADMAAAIRWAAVQPAEDGKPNLLVLDSATLVWDTLKDKATFLATKRGSTDRNGEVVVGMDLWNKVNQEWAGVLTAVRSHKGPVILTARLDTVAVIGANGKPTTAKTEKVKGQRSLAYDVDAIVEMPERGIATLTGARSVIHKLPARTDLPEFDKGGVDWLWRKLGLDRHQVAQPTYTDAVTEDASLFA
ncbi:AAA family ATPase [Leucobacter sp. M11]|uniref:AAA family ATPase n=1 Tax=Leucobacter sp. M11 TaxID=2993565 RepID=UPI002D7ED3E4|nr:AAA family ATPase [Leucobacter sp. M11]MEB4614033.1 AAA family ATPase [Leucobacter sp. M11]